VGADFPVFFPVSREYGREKFAQDCILLHLLKANLSPNEVRLGLPRCNLSQTSERDLGEAPRKSLFLILFMLTRVAAKI
jgi:hypothetical protein